VTGEQDADATYVGQQHHTRVVDRRAVARGILDINAWSGPDHRPGDIAHPLVFAEVEVDLTNTVWQGHLVRHLGDRPDPAPGKYAAQSARVVRVVMGEHDERHRVDTQVVETPVDEPRLRPGVDDHGFAVPCVECNRIALSHIAHHHHPAVRRPTDRNRTYG